MMFLLIAFFFMFFFNFLSFLIAESAVADGLCALFSVV